MSGTLLPPDIRVVLRFGAVEAPRRWRARSGGSELLYAEFRDRRTKALVPVSGVQFAWRWPGAAPGTSLLMPCQELQPGLWAGPIAPLADRTWAARVTATEPAIESEEILMDVVASDFTAGDPLLIPVITADGALVAAPDGSLLGA